MADHVFHAGYVVCLFYRFCLGFSRSHYTVPIRGDSRSYE